MAKVDKNKIRGIVMAGVGFLMLLVNALAYILDWDIKNVVFTVLGLVFVIIGLKLFRK
jgi:hypothetical protein